VYKTINRVSVNRRPAHITGPASSAVQLHERAALQPAAATTGMLLLQQWGVRQNRAPAGMLFCQSTV
jgi:hypothetical protein